MRFSTAASEIKPDFLANRFLMGLTGIYAAVWIWAAVAPHYRFDWFLENILTMLVIMILVATYRRFPLSDTSYLLLFVFLVMHAVGGHYTYSLVPLGFWMQETFGLARNHFDRLVHLSFGLLLFYPMREVILRTVTRNSLHAGLFALSLNWAMSGSFEIIEWFIAQIVNPEAGTAYLGTQGDEWDAQKDMALASVGSLVAFMAVEVIVRSRTITVSKIPERH